MFSVYGPGGTGLEILDYPDKMFDSIKVNLKGIDTYDPRALAGALMAAMRAKKITFSDTSNIVKVDSVGQNHEQNVVEVTPELIEKWRALGRAGASWVCQRYRGTAFDMPGPA
jgi:hypothetical protein